MVVVGGTEVYVLSTYIIRVNCFFSQVVFSSFSFRSQVHALIAIQLAMTET